MEARPDLSRHLSQISNANEREDKINHMIPTAPDDGSGIGADHFQSYTQVAQVSDAAERRRMQNRISQRNHRSRCKSNSGQADSDSSNTLIWTQPHTIPLPPTSVRDNKHHQKRQQQKTRNQRSQSKRGGFLARGSSSASATLRSAFTTSPHESDLLEKEKAQLSQGTEVCVLMGEKNHENQADADQDDMEWINRLPGDSFSLDEFAESAYADPVLLASDTLSKDFSNYLEVRKPPVTMAMVSGGGGIDETMEDDSGQARTGDVTDGGGSGGEGDSGEDDIDVAIVDGLEEEVLGYNALHLAAYLGQAGMVQLLLQFRPEDADRAADSGRRQAPLHIAAAHHHVDVIRVLLDNGAKVRLQDSRGCTPLHIAIRAGADAVARLLARGGVDLLHIRDATGRTPLHDAIIKGNEEMVRLLLDHGADPTMVVMREQT